MKTVYLVRHAKAEGQLELAQLTEKGLKQAVALIDFFKNKQIDRIYSSPFIRAVETIKPTALEKNIGIIEDSRLGERVLSRIQIEDWKGKLKQSFDNFDLVFEGGESHADGMNRAASILKDVLKSDDQNIVLVSHGNLTTLLLRYFNESFGFEHLMGMTNPDVFEVAVTGEQCVIHRIWDDRV